MGRGHRSGWACCPVRSLQHGAGSSDPRGRHIAIRRTGWTLALAISAAFASACASGTPSEPLDPPDPNQWAAVDSVIAATLARSGQAGNLTLSVYNTRDSLVFERTYGNFSPTQVIAVASASKLVASMLLLDLVAAGELSLESTTGSVLGWDGVRGTITLRQLLSFTSGMVTENLCTINPFITLTECVNAIANTGLVATLGTRFDYGSTHLAVAARMAELATGERWNTLFRARLADPLGLSQSAQFYALPNQALGTLNPLVAGGLRISSREYGALLALAFHKGSSGGVTVGTPALFDAMAREPFPSVAIGNSPAVSLGTPFRYGLGAWLECDTPATGCAVISSAGAFGFTPWLDRSAGYFATLAMERLDGGGTGFSVQLQQALRPFLAQAVR